MLTYLLKLNRKIVTTVLLAIVSAGGGECVMGNDHAEAAQSRFWKAWRVDADTAGAADASLLTSLQAPEDSAAVLHETRTPPDGYEYSYVGVNEGQKGGQGTGYYAFQAALNVDNETFFPFYSGDELIICDGQGNPYDFVGLSFTGEIDGRFIGLYVSDGTKTFAYNAQGHEGGLDDPFTAQNFIDEQREALKNIFTSVEEKDISFTLLIESENVESLYVGGFFEMWPNSMEHATPEPGTLLIFGIGLTGAGLFARRRKK